MLAGIAACSLITEVLANEELIGLVRGLRWFEDGVGWVIGVIAWRDRRRVGRGERGERG